MEETVVYTAKWLSFVPEPDRWVVGVLIVFATAFILAELFKRFGMSEMVGEIIAGIIFGIGSIKAGILNQEAISTISHVGEVGALFLLALAGLEIEIDKIKKTSIDSVAIALLSFIIPFALGYWYTSYLGYDWRAAFLVGIVLGVTAEEIATKVYLELGILNTKIGAATVMAAVVDDVIEVIALAAVLALITKGSLHGFIKHFPPMVALFFIVSLIAVKILQRVFVRYRGDMDGLFWMMLVILLGFSAIGAALALGPIIGAILGGFFTQMALRRAYKYRPDLEEKIEEALEYLEKMLMAFLVPFFFVKIGLEFELHYLVEYPVILAIMTAIAFIGKIGGTMLAKPVSKLSLRQLWFIGWAMNARGTLGMILTLVGLEYGLIGRDIYTTVIAMAMITTVTFPFVVKAEYKRNPKIVD